MASVDSGPWGPCCSVEPIGTITVLWSATKASTSGFVISPRNTVGRFVMPAPPRRVASGDGRRQLPDALDPARHVVARLEMSVRTRRRREPGRRAGGDEITGLQPDVAAEVADHLGDREAHVSGPAILDRLAIDRAAEPHIARIELV